MKALIAAFDFDGVKVGLVQLAGGQSIDRFKGCDHRAGKTLNGQIRLYLRQVDNTRANRSDALAFKLGM